MSQSHKEKLEGVSILIANKVQKLLGFIIKDQDFKHTKHSSLTTTIEDELSKAFPEPQPTSSDSELAEKIFALCTSDQAYENPNGALKAIREFISTHNESQRQRVVEVLQKAFSELNTIRARDGVPYCYDGFKSSVDEDYFSSVVDDIDQLLRELKGEKHD